MAIPTGPSIEFLRDVTPANWIEGRLHDFCTDTGSVVPEGFEAYARLFHPVEDRHGRRRWSDVARENGRIVHPEMQFHTINRAVNTAAPQEYEQGYGPSSGSLPLPERTVLLEVLRLYTTTPEQCWFCLWEGFGGIDYQGVAERVWLPYRNYLLYSGPIEMVLASPPATPDVPSELVDVHAHSPNLWWPDDRAWFVATEIDFAWTYIGGTPEMINRVLTDQRLEVLSARLSDSPLYSGDRLNAALDEG